MLESLQLKALLHTVSQDALYPTMFILVALIVYAVFCVGSLLAEFLTERRYYKANMPAFINAINDADAADLVSVIEASGMLLSQKRALATVARNMGLPEDELYALAKTQIQSVNARYTRIVSRNDFAAKVSPMFGLMGTLIPLGPGIVAMGKGEVETLATSMNVAFDTTVAGLITAVICLLVARVRRAWYTEYANSLEAAMLSILEKARIAREAGLRLPSGYVPQDSGKSAFGRAAEKSQAPAAAYAKEAE